MEKTTEGVEQHTQTDRLEEHVAYPHHPNRKASYLYVKNHKTLVKQMNLPCFKCFMKTIDGPLPAKAYEKREVHHYLLEWATWNAVDPRKVQKILDNGFFDPYGFAAKMKGQPFESPDDIRNLFVLCHEHHMDHSIGIHHTDGPLWLSDMVAKDGIDILLSKEEWTLLNEGKAELNDEGRVIILESA